MILQDKVIIITGAGPGMGQAGRQVTIVDQAERLGAGLQVVRRWRVLDELHHLGVTMLAAAQHIEIGDHVVRYANPGGQVRTLAADHVIVA